MSSAVCHSSSPVGTGHPFQPGESAPSQNQQDFCPLPAPRFAQLWLRSVQSSRYRLPRMAGQLSGGTGARHQRGIIILTYVLTSLDLTCLFMQFSTIPVSNTHTLRQSSHTAFLLGKGREQGGT